MFETILLVGNGALSSSLQKFLKKERVVVFDKDNIDRLIHTKGDLLIDCSLPDAFDSVYTYLKKTGFLRSSAPRITARNSISR